MRERSEEGERGERKRDVCIYDGHTSTYAIIRASQASSKGEGEGEGEGERREGGRESERAREGESEGASETRKRKRRERKREIQHLPSTSLYTCKYLFNTFPLLLSVHM